MGEEKRCRRCGLRVYDDTWDMGNGLVLIAECDGIRVKVAEGRGFRELPGVMTRAEVQHFLDTAYGTDRA